MILYVILVFAAVLVGMAVSVLAFGTGGKRSRIFQDIYFTVEEVEGIGVLYTKNGDYSAVLRMENPVQKYSANIDAYYEFTSLFTTIAETLGRAMRSRSRTSSAAGASATTIPAAASSSPTATSAISTGGSTPTPSPAW
jgi:hypothetical protein